MKQTYQFQEKKFRILALGADNGACGNMRIRRPFKWLNKLEGVEANILEGHKFDEKDLKRIFSMTDLFVVKPGQHGLAKEIRKVFPQKPIVFDFDDDLFNVLPSSGHYVDYGTSEIAHEVDGKQIDLWKQGRDGFDKWKNKHRLLDLQEALEESDMVTAVTQRLGQYLSERAGGREVAVIPNFIDGSLFPDVDIVDNEKNGEFRFGFCGGMSHYGDINMVKDSIIKFLKQDKKRVFYMIGQEFKGFEAVKDQVRHEEWLPFEANPMRIKSLDLDCLIAPLGDYPFNNRKDPLKFWDASGLKLPLVASKVAPFIDVIEHGKNGFLFEDNKEFIKILKKLEKDRGIGKKIGALTYKEIKERTLEKKAQIILDFYKSVWNRKREEIKLSFTNNAQEVRKETQGSGQEKGNE